MATEMTTTQEAALERKKRLQALRNKYKPESAGTESGLQERVDGDSGNSGDETETSAKRLRRSPDPSHSQSQERPSILFRNYKPTDQSLRELSAPEGRPERFDEQVQATLSKEAIYDPLKGIDLSTLAPKKYDWDLKRDVSEKLEKLERRTQKAIVHLIRDRLKGQEDRLADAVSTIGDEKEKDSPH